MIFFWLTSPQQRYYRQHSVLNNIPKSQMGSSTGTLQYAAPPRPLCMVWGRNNPWVRPASRDSPNLVASRNILEKSSGSRLLDESRRFSSPASHSTSQVPSQPSPSTTLCVICQDEEANIAIISCGYVKKPVFKLAILMLFLSIGTWHYVEAALTRLWKAHVIVLCVE